VLAVKKEEKSLALKERLRKGLFLLIRGISSESLLLRINLDNHGRSLWDAAGVYPWLVKMPFKFDLSVKDKDRQ
jgi:hypothetical protein